MKNTKTLQKKKQEINLPLYIVHLSNHKAEELKSLSIDSAENLIFLSTAPAKEQEAEGIPIVDQPGLISHLQTKSYSQIIILGYSYWKNNRENYKEITSTIKKKENSCLISNEYRWGKTSIIGWSMTSDIAINLLKENILTQKFFFGRIQFYFRNLGIPFKKVYSQYRVIDKDSRKTGLNLKFLITWYFVNPFLKNSFKSVNGLQPIVFRGLFVVLSLIILLILPIMSTDIGISGDEEKHYKHAEYVYNYFASAGKDTTALNQPRSLLHHYGQSFDNLAYILEKWLNIENPYEFRHFLNSLTGAAAIIFAGLIAVLLFGWRTGFITLLFMFFSPRWLGHSLNNPIDIPFALGCTMTLYYIFRFNREFPHPSWRNILLIAVGLGIAIGIRIGGLLFIAFTIFYTGLHYLSQYGINGLFQKNKRPVLMRLIVFVFFTCIIGYGLGLLLWPYALQNPLKNPILSLSAMTNISNSLRQVFEGKVIWSDAVPWYYSSKYILITIPLFIHAGLILSLLFIKKNIKTAGWPAIFALLFTIFFPVFWIVYKESNVYGGWRHLYFIYPPMVVLAAVGFSNILNLQNKWARYAIWLILLGFLSNPVIHLLKNYPNHYVYYNQFAGGTDGALGQYEMDYYYNSLKTSADWIIENKIPDLDENETITIASNHADLTNYYFRNYPQVKVRYVRYYERGNSDWDYATFVNSYISPHQLRKGTWPPANTIHEIQVDNSPICAILERKSRFDLQAHELASQKQFAAAISLYQVVIKEDPKYEAAYLNLTKIYLDMGNYQKTIEYANQCLRIYPQYNQALYYMGLAYVNTNRFDYAIQTFNRLLKANSKYHIANYYLGYSYANKNDFDRALRYLETSMIMNPGFPGAYYLTGQIYEARGNKALAQQYYQQAQALQ